MKLSIEKWNVSLDSNDDTICVGLGWWSGSAILWCFGTQRYDGGWFGFRFGPLFFCRGPF